MGKKYSIMDLKKPYLYTICCGCKEIMKPKREYPACEKCYKKFKEGVTYDECISCNTKFSKPSVFHMCFKCYFELCEENCELEEK